MASLCLVAAPSFAQNAQYQSRILGQHAMGIGGAFTAVANDPTASYYNPGGLARLTELQLEVGLPVLGIEYLRVYRGLIAQDPERADASSVQLVALPTTVGAATTFGPRDKFDQPIFAAAVSLLIPQQRALALRQTLQGDQGSALHLIQEYEQTLLIGPSIAVRAGPVGIGASLFYSHQNIFWLDSRTGTLRVCEAVGCRNEASYSVTTVTEGWVGGLNLRLGLLWKITPSVSVGMMGSLSSLRVFGVSSVKTRRNVAHLSLGTVDEALLNQENAPFERRLPWELRTGVAWTPSRRSLLAFDLTFYLPDSFEMFRGVDQGLSLYPGQIRRNFIFNANFGGEYYVARKVPLRGGLFTNLSAADPVALDPLTPGGSRFAATRGCDRLPCQPYIHSIGVTASIGVELWRVAVNFGLNAQYGHGFRQQVSTVDSRLFRWSEVQQVSFHLFIAGNIGKVLTEGFEDLQDRLKPEQPVPEESTEPVDSPDVREKPRERARERTPSSPPRRQKK